jgi:protocatechuate 3,4-dioxygenase beta subunit
MNRRNLLQKTFLGAAALASLPTTTFAQQCLLTKTPAQTAGPFYPVVSQVDTNADLVRVIGRTEIAKGEIVIIQGLLTDQYCKPVRGALVEIWQACSTGKYDHPSDPNTAELDTNFQYWGKAVTDADGKYKFRTIKPGSYPADTDWIRPPHVHFKVSALGYIELITQMYFLGEDLNNKDLILQRLKKDDQKKVVIEFKKVANELHDVGFFDIQIEKI